MNNLTIEKLKNLVKRSLLEDPTGDDWLDSRYKEQVHYIGHTNPYYKLFYLLAKEFEPQTVVELGSWQGTGACHFASGNPNGEVYTIDIHREDKEAQKRCYEAEQYYNNLHYINKWTWDAAVDIKLLGKPIDILFIDAWHSYQYVKREWDLYSSLLAKPALVICDDITSDYNFDGMSEFWKELPEPKFLDIAVHPGIPFGFCIVNEVKKAFNEEEENIYNAGIVFDEIKKSRGRPKKTNKVQHVE